MTLRSTNIFLLVTWEGGMIYGRLKTRFVTAGENEENADFVVVCLLL